MIKFIQLIRKDQKWNNLYLQLDFNGFYNEIRNKQLMNQKSTFDHLLSMNIFRQN